MTTISMTKRGFGALIKELVFLCVCGVWVCFFLVNIIFPAESSQSSPVILAHSRQKDPSWACRVYSKPQGETNKDKYTFPFLCPCQNVRISPHPENCPVEATWASCSTSTSRERWGPARGILQPSPHSQSPEVTLMGQVNLV